MFFDCCYFPLFGLFATVVIYFPAIKKEAGAILPRLIRKIRSTAERKILRFTRDDSRHWHDWNGRFTFAEK